jgi:adenylosuccinate lyase
MKDDGSRNDMLERLARDTSFPVSGVDLRASTDPLRFVGRAPEQVDEFLAGVVQPILDAAGEVHHPLSDEVRV